MIMTGSGACARSGEIGFPGSAQADQLRGGERRPQDLKALRVELRRQDADLVTSPPGRAMLLAKPTPTKSFAYARGGDGGGGVPEHAEAERLRAHEHASSGIWAALLAHADELIE